MPISDADLSSLYRIGDGGLSPLIGPMDRADMNRVLDDEVILHDGKHYAWTIPIAFRHRAEGPAATLKAGETVGLVNAAGDIVGSLDVKDVFPWDKAKYIKSVYSTDRDRPSRRPHDHETMPTDMLLGGDVLVLPQPKKPEYGKYILSPLETRSLFARRAGSASSPSRRAIRCTAPTNMPWFTASNS